MDTNVSQLVGPPLKCRWIGSDSGSKDGWIVIKCCSDVHGPQRIQLVIWPGLWFTALFLSQALFDIWRFLYRLQGSFLTVGPTFITGAVVGGWMWELNCLDHQLTAVSFSLGCEIIFLWMIVTFIHLTVFWFFPIHLKKHCECFFFLVPKDPVSATLLRSSTAEGDCFTSSPGQC